GDAVGSEDAVTRDLSENDGVRLVVRRPAQPTSERGRAVREEVAEPLARHAHSRTPSDEPEAHHALNGRDDQGAGYERPYPGADPRQPEHDREGDDAGSERARRDLVQLHALPEEAVRDATE